MVDELRDGAAAGSAGGSGRPSGDRPARVPDDPRIREADGPRTNVAEFLARQRAGALPAGPRAELIDGRVEVPSLPRSVEVAAVVGLASRLEPVLLGRAELAFLPPLRLGPRDLLRPDLALLDASPRFGREASRAGGEALLAVEVLRGARSMDARLPRYARGGVGEVWLLDLENVWLEVYRAPAAGRFRSRTLWYPGERVEPVALDGVKVEVLASL